MTDSPAPSSDHTDQTTGSNSPRGESALRTILLVVVFGMIPVIGLLIYLNIHKGINEMDDPVPQTTQGQAIDEVPAVPVLQE